MTDSPVSGVEIRLDASFDITGYVNIAPGKTCAQSSSSRYSHRDLASRLVDPPLKADYAIHTDVETHPWWSIDLGAAHRDLIILIYNRAHDPVTAPGSLRRRALPLVVQSSEDGAHWTALVDIGQSFGDVASGAPLSVRLRRRAGQPPIRHIRLLVRQAHTCLHLQLVQIFAPESAAGAAPESEADLMRAFHDCLAPGVSLEAALDSFTRDEVTFVPGQRFATIDAVQVVRFNRLGNSIIGALNGLLFAEEHGIGRVYLAFDHLRPGFAIPETCRFGRIEIRVGKPVAGEASFLMRSRFYFGHYLPRALQRATHRLTPILRQAIRPVLMSGIAEGAFDAGTVVIHIRSGDLFRSERGVHPNYVQPPLAYYLACLEHADAQHPVVRVILVHEDRANPCVDALEAHLRTVGIPCTMQSGTLREDTATIFGARRIIAGQGTFVPTLIAQSSQLEVVYFFRRVMLSHLFDTDATRVFVARDLEGRFTAYGDWANTAEQRQLMLDYPRAAMAVEMAHRGR